jgi:hypothetical protein
VRTLRASATAGANALGAIAGEWTRAGRTGREHSVLARTEGNLHAAIAMGTRVWVQTGATSGAGPNGRVLQGGRAHAVAEGAHAATGVGQGCHADVFGRTDGRTDGRSDDGRGGVRDLDAL